MTEKTENNLTFVLITQQLETEFWDWGTSDSAERTSTNGTLATNRLSLTRTQAVTLIENGTAEEIAAEALKRLEYPGDFFLRDKDPTALTDWDSQQSAKHPGAKARGVLVTIHDKDTYRVEEVEGKGPRPSADIDEFLMRLGCVIEVNPPLGINPAEDFEGFWNEVPAGIFHPKDCGSRRTGPVETRTGSRPGHITTTTADLEPFGLIKAVGKAARFRALEILHERNQDVLDSIPEDVAPGLDTEHVTVSSRLTEEVPEEKSLEQKMLIDEFVAADIKRLQDALHLLAHLHVKCVGSAARPDVVQLAKGYNPGPWGPADC